MGAHGEMTGGVGRTSPSLTEVDLANAIRTLLRDSSAALSGVSVAVMRNTAAVLNVEVMQNCKRNSGLINNILNYGLLYCTVPYCTVLYCTVLYCVFVQC